MHIKDIGMEFGLSNVVCSLWKKNKTVKQEVMILADGITMKEIHET